MLQKGPLVVDAIKEHWISETSSYFHRHAWTTQENSQKLCLVFIII